VTRSQDIRTLVRLPLRARLAVFLVGVAILWGAALLGESHLPVDLTVVLLLALTLVLALAVVIGPVLGIVAGLIAVVLVNWYLVPPYGTFAVASTENVVALVVFAFVAGVVAILAELNARVQAGAARSRERAGLIAEVVSKDEDATAQESLDRVRRALDLDRLSLLRDGDGPVELLATAGTGPTSSDGPVALDVRVTGGYRLVGLGGERMAEDPGFVESLAAAAVRSYESDRMETEQLRAERLAAVDEARTALLASVGHDLRTPLSGLRLAVDALRDPGSHLDDESRRDLLETVDDSTARLDELITNLLDMSRLEAGVVMARVAPTPVDAAVAAAVLAFPRAAVTVDVSDTLPLVLADPALLERVVENLVSNALRYAGPSADSPVHVTAYELGDAVAVDVVDHGPGLAATAHTDPASLDGSAGRADRSAGLGLAIVRGFCAAMRVTLEFHDTDGGGLTVRLLAKEAAR
jgi:two-component system sensor histidine kinase KdpD